MVHRKALWPKILLTVLFAAMLYVLSYGPACWIFWKYDLPDWAKWTIDKVYTPLWMAASTCESTEQALHWYMMLWFPDPFGTPGGGF